MAQRPTEPAKPAAGPTPDVQEQVTELLDPAPKVAGAERPASPQKIIIRSGDIEFEVESFDSAVATVTKLVTAIKNAFVATVNSEKLPNGKVKGSMVVRVPRLPKFTVAPRRPTLIEELLSPTLQQMPGRILMLRRNPNPMSGVMKRHHSVSASNNWHI